LKRLLYITTNLQSSGGLARILAIKLNYLVETFNYDIHVITTYNQQSKFFYEFDKRIKFHPNPVNRISLSNVLKYKKALQEKVASISADVIINCDNGFKGALLPYLLSDDSPMIYEMHRERAMTHEKGFQYLKIKLSNVLLRKTFKKYKKVVVLTEAQKNEWMDDNFLVLPNPNTVAVATKANIKNRKALVVGRLTPVKGYMRLLHIWKQISLNHPDWLLEIYGAGDQEPYRKEIEKLHIGNSVTLKGATPAIYEKYKEASVLFNTSYSESFGLSMLEAMSFGVPVMAFKTYGSEELVTHEINGYLVEQNDVNTFVKLFSLMAEDESTHKRLSDQAQRSVDRYQPEAIMNKWHKLFLQL